MTGPMFSMNTQNSLKQQRTKVNKKVIYCVFFMRILALCELFKKREGGGDKIGKNQFNSFIGCRIYINGRDIWGQNTRTEFCRWNFSEKNCNLFLKIYSENSVCKCPIRKKLVHKFFSQEIRQISSAKLSRQIFYPQLSRPLMSMRN